MADDRLSKGAMGPGQALLNQGELLPVSMYTTGTKAADAFRLMNNAEWVYAKRQLKQLTQRHAARDLNIPLRQLQSLESIARWPPEAREFVKRHSAKIHVGALMRRVVNQRWGSKSALLAELKRISSELPVRKRAKVAGQASRADVAAAEDRIRERLQTKVRLVTSGTNGEICINFSSLEEFDRLMALLGV